VPRRRRRRRLSPPARRILRNLTILGLLAVVLVGGLAGIRILQAARALHSAESSIDDARGALDAGDIAGAETSLRSATQHLTKAAGQLHGHVELDVVRAVPLLGGNLKAVRDSVAVATKLTAGGAEVLAAAKPLEQANGSLEVPLRKGAIPLAAVEAVQEQAEILARELPDPDQLARQDPGFLLPPVRHLRDRFVDEVVRRRDQTRALADGLALVSEMAGGHGERKYLIAVANSAEMRGSGGMVLNYGGIIGSGGQFQLTAFGRIDDLALKAPIDRQFVPDLPDDYLRRWDGFDPLLRWRNATMGADFTMVAPVLEAMFVARTGVQVDGVVQIDPAGLASLLGAVGPVEVPELGEVGADNLVPVVLNQAYIRYHGIEERSDVLRTVAEAAFRKLVTGQYESLRPVGAALAEAVRGRHLMFHSYREDPERRVAAFGADGALPPLEGPDAVHLTVQNVSGNKLDFFVQTAVGLSGDVSPGKPRTVRAEVAVRNTAPVGATDPPYIFGPFNSDQKVGVYRGVVSLYLPKGATLLSTSGDPPRDPPIQVSEGGRPIVSWTVDLPAGTTSHVVLELRLPARTAAAPYQLIAVPSPRVIPTVLKTDLETGSGRIAGTVTLDRTWRLTAGRRPQAVVAPG
jgi:hypothetical protein